MFTIADIAAATGGMIVGSSEGMVVGISTDSRTISPGDLFVPLVGPRFDGHSYIAEVAAKGVSIILSAEMWATTHPFPAGINAVVVKETLRALGDLAAAYRARHSIKVVGVTGSNGKTTTKEMLASIMALTGPGLKSSGNLNNLIGLPLTIFQLHHGLGWAVLEMGMSEPGEIDRLAEIARPDVGIITNVFASHLESMGNVENVARAKGELFLRLPPGGTAVYNADDPLVAALPSRDGVARRSFGLQGGEVTASEITRAGIGGQHFILHIDGSSIKVFLNACGMHFLVDALAAAAAAQALGIAPEMIRQGLERFRPGDRRFTIERTGPLLLIDDSYNANPASMSAALKTLTEVKGGSRAFVVLGDMLELGADAESLHRRLGEMAAGVAWRLYLRGAMASVVAAGASRAGLAPSSIVITESHEEIATDILARAELGDTVLVKGSRGMRMDRVATLIREAFPAGKEDRT